MNNEQKEPRPFNPADGNVTGTKYEGLTTVELANPNVQALMNAGVSVQTIRTQTGSNKHKQAHFVDHSDFNMTAGGQ